MKRSRRAAKRRTTATSRTFWRPKLELLEDRRLLAPFVVSNATSDASDIAPGNGICDSDPGLPIVCNLRAAVQETNALSGADIITFSLASYTNPVNLNSQLDFISGTLTIEGHTTSGVPDLTVQRNPLASTDYRVFSISLGGNVTLKKMIISGGRAAQGGAFTMRAR